MTSLPKHCPTPSEIRAACELIQGEWSEEQKLRRSDRSTSDELETRLVRFGDGLKEPEEE